MEDVSTSVNHKTRELHFNQPVVAPSTQWTAGDANASGVARRWQLPLVHKQLSVQGANLLHNSNLQETMALLISPLPITILPQDFQQGQQG